MNYNAIAQRPDANITEDWIWTTDLMTAYNGSEDCLPLLRYPKRAFGGTYSFESVAAVSTYAASMFSQFRNLIKLPLYQYMVVLKAPVSAGDDTIAVNATRSDLRAGCIGFIAEGDTWEEVEVATVAANEVTFEEPLTNDYSKRAIFCPMTQVYTLSGASIARTAPDNSASASFRFAEFMPWAPFVDPLNEEELTLFETIPVLEEVPTGTQFDQIVQHGTDVTEFIGIPDLNETWLQSKFAYNVTFLCNRTLDLASWHRWIVFADYCQGSMNTFLLPTNRADLAVVTPAVGSGNQVTVDGDLYSENYFGFDCFKRIVITSDAGKHYARVTGVASISGNDRLTFTPALPAGAAWDDNQKISFLLLVRNSTDKISCKHVGLETMISFSIRTAA